MSVTLHYSRGSVEAVPGMRFKLFLEPDAEWEIVGFTGGRIYSPSGLGGTPIVIAQLVAGEASQHMRQFIDSEGYIEFCGDSVGAALSCPARRDGGIS